MTTTKKPSKSTTNSKGKERPPPIDKLLKPAVGIALALLAYQFFKGINSEIPRIDVNDELELRQVFFGEGFDETPTTSSTTDAPSKPVALKYTNFAVLCHQDSSSDTTTTSTNIPVSSVFQEAYNDNSAPAEFRLLDCNHLLASSEKTIAERFKLNLKQRPTVFVSGQVGPPKQVPTKFLKTGSMLVKALKNLLEPKAEKVETTQDLRTKCLDKEVCGLLLKGSKQSPKYVKDALTKLVVEHPKVSFAAVDTSVLYLKNLEEYLPELVDGQPRFVMFRKVSGSLDAKSKERLKTSIAAIPTSGVSYGQMSSLVVGVLSKSQEMTKLPALPTIKTRTKKLVQEEQAKRARKLDQQRRQQEGSSSNSGGGEQFTANDGSAEGRRAERERRRAEHRANNPNFREKTPEEKAEMERQRRKRMEEEAAKWNIAPEDAPEEGEAVQDDDDYDEDDLDVDDGDDAYDIGGDDDDEDVMDLD